MAKLVSDTYGQALFDLALEKNALDETAKEADSVRKAFLANHELLDLLNHPKISREEKIQVAEKIFGDRVSDMIVGLLVTMIDKGRTGKIIDVLEYFLNQADEYRLIGKASVTSAVELSDAQKNDIVKKLISTTKYKRFNVNYTVDKNIIGGLVIRIGDRVVDSSIRTKLDSLSRELYGLQI